MRIFLVTTFFLLVSHILPAQVLVDVESGLVFQGYNRVQVPNPDGTRFDLNRDFNLQGPVIPLRIRVNYTIGERHNIAALWAPFSANYDGAVDFDIDFEGSRFPAGTALSNTYVFNSYRLTYRYDIVKSTNWTVGIGFTGKIRDAKIELESTDGTVSRTTDLGFVPLLHLYTAYTGGKVMPYFEADGLAGGPGRAFDVFAGASVPLSPWMSVKAGYRLLEGGADIEQVYNFTILHYAVVGLQFRW